MLGFRVYADAVVPVAILTQAPAVLGAGWWILIRIDLGLVLAAVAALRLLDGGVRLARTGRAMRLSARSASRAPGSGAGLAVSARG